MSNKEVYTHAVNSPLFVVWRYESAKLGRCLHFDLEQRQGKTTFYMFTYFKDRDNSLYRDMSPIAARHECYTHEMDFERELVKFIQKIKRYTVNDQIQLTREQYKEIREFFRERRKNPSAVREIV